MTATNINDLIAAADLNDRTDRLMLADAFDDAGRRKEAKRLRSGREVTLEGGVILAVNYEIRYLGAPYGEGEAGELVSGHKSHEKAAAELYRLCRSNARYYGSNAIVVRVIGNNLRRERVV